MQPANWTFTELFPMIAGPVLSIVLGYLILFAILTPLRDRKWKYTFQLNLALTILGGTIWYFYPSFRYKGTYTAKIERWKQTQTITIDEKYAYEDFVSGTYRVNPLCRTLTVQLDDPLGSTTELTVMLRWNHVYQPVFRCGRVKFKRTPLEEKTSTDPQT